MNKLNMLYFLCHAQAGTGNALTVASLILGIGKPYIF